MEDFLGLNVDIWNYIIIPIIAAVLGFLGSIISAYIKNYFNSEQRKGNKQINLHGSNFPVMKENDKDPQNKKNSEIRDMLSSILEEARKELNVDRTWIAKFHNGDIDGHYPSDNPWQLISIIKDSPKAGVSSSINFQHIPVSLYKPFLVEIMDIGYFAFDNIDEVKTIFKNLMENQGIKSTCGVGIFNNAGRLKGIIGFDNITTSKNIDQCDIKKLIRYGRIASKHLPLYTVNRKVEKNR